MDKQTTFIYALKCPKTGDIRYIGKSNNPKQRFYGHLRTDKTASSHKVNWVQSLLNSGLKPVLEILEEISIKEWKEKERYYIAKYRKKYRLTNCKDGGEGLDNKGNQTSFKKGTKSWNTGTRKEKKCAICGKIFEVSPTGDKRYKCCSMKCSLVYRSEHPNNGCFKKGNIPINITKVLQIDKITGEVLNKYNSIKEAQDCLGITHISCAINGNRKTVGGFKWKRVE
jgi:hypothetical protein